MLNLGLIDLKIALRPGPELSRSPKFACWTLRADLTAAEAVQELDRTYVDVGSATRLFGRLPGTQTAPLAV